MRITIDSSDTNVGANNVEYFNYKPFGDQLTVNGDTAKPGKIGFIGKERDEENSYFLLGARQYDPATGRFLSVDPMWEYFPNYNPYHYCYNNPISFKDPTGLAPEEEKEDELLSKQKEDELQVASNKSYERKIM